jgi:hypothetical protein
VQISGDVPEPVFPALALVVMQAKGNNTLETDKGNSENKRRNQIMPAF